MSAQIILIIALAFLVLLLTFLLISRLRLEKRQQVSIELMEITELIDFLRTNSIDGKIQVVAGKVSSVLKSAFKCQSILFLRKQRGFLELNYYHGVYRFNRDDFKIRFTPELANRMKEGFSPQPLTSMQSFLPSQMYEKLTNIGINLFFPIFWRDNLYGIYFIKSSLETTTPGFSLLVASLAHSLSAAYHVKWHESRYEKLQQRILNGEIQIEQGKLSPEFSFGNMFDLVRHRNSDMLIPRIIETIQHELELPKIALFYRSKNRLDDLRTAKCGIPDRLDTPQQKSFNEILSQINSNEFTQLDRMKFSNPQSNSWLENLKSSGMKYVMSFPLSSRREGILAIGEGGTDGAVNRLNKIVPSAQLLLDNAESYEEMEALSYTDNLTGLANQRYFRKRLSEEIDRALRYHRSLALIVFDMDSLKAINDQYGHFSGDSVIRDMGPILKSSIRAIDIIARYGGDEFCIIMPEADLPTCERFMNRLNTRIANTKFKLPGGVVDIGCTICSGGAVFPQHAQNAESLFLAADLALLKAKSMGKNQSVVYSLEVQNTPG